MARTLLLNKYTAFFNFWKLPRLPLMALQTVSLLFPPFLPLRVLSGIAPLLTYLARFAYPIVGWDSNMQQSKKRSKVAKESIIPDITESVVQVSETLNAIGQTHQLLLKANDIFVKYLVEEEKKKKSKVIIPPAQDQGQ